MKNVLLLLALFFLFSCKKDNTKELSEQINQWMGKKIEYPDDMLFMKLAKDTVAFPFANSDHKVLVYVDSTGCTSCKLQLRKWKDFMVQADSLRNKTISYLFIFQTKDQKELQYLLKRDDFNYPVVIDIDNSFNKRNNLPENSIFHTLLLDKDNKVVLIGNPIHNPSVKDLYIQVLSGNYMTENSKNTSLKFMTKELELGNIVLGDTFKTEIIVENIGDEPFELKDILTSCDCTHAKADWKTIPPKQQTVVEIRYVADKKGDFMRTISLYGNIEEKSITLNIFGNVI